MSMRARRVTMLVGALAMTVSGCSSPEPAPAASVASLAAPSPATVGPTASPSPSSASPVDLTVKRTNTAGYPSCGFRTWVEDFYGQKVTHIGLLVAVEPAGSTDELGLYIYVPGDQMYFSATFRDGKIVRGTSWTPPGASFTYVLQEVGVLPGSGSGYLTQRTTITVTVDRPNDVHETNEANNVLTMKARAPNRRSFDITDSTCTVS
jgi:hypothetical protein